MHLNSWLAADSQWNIFTFFCSSEKQSYSNFTSKLENIDSSNYWVIGGILIVLFHVIIKWQKENVKINCRIFMQWYNVIRYSMMQYAMMWYDTVWCDMIYGSRRLGFGNWIKSVSNGICLSQIKHCCFFSPISMTSQNLALSHSSVLPPVFMLPDLILTWKFYQRSNNKCIHYIVCSHYFKKAILFISKPWKFKDCPSEKGNSKCKLQWIIKCLCQILYSQKHKLQCSDLAN